LQTSGDFGAPFLLHPLTIGPGALNVESFDPLPFRDGNHRRKLYIPMSVDVRKLRYFVSVFEEGSFTRAAKRENIVQPALSVQITQLEKELTVKLFERSSQGIQATLAGEHYYKFCKTLLRSLEAATQEMRDFSGVLPGSFVPA
jgi:hypothetical protein